MLEKKNGIKGRIHYKHNSGYKSFSQFYRESIYTDAELTAKSSLQLTHSPLSLQLTQSPLSLQPTFEHL